MLGDLFYVQTSTLNSWIWIVVSVGWNPWPWVLLHVLFFLNMFVHITIFNGSSYPLWLNPFLHDGQTVSECIERILLWINKWSWLMDWVLSFSSFFITFCDVNFWAVNLGFFCGKVPLIQAELLLLLRWLGWSTEVDFKDFCSNFFTFDLINWYRFFRDYFSEIWSIRKLIIGWTLLLICLLQVINFDAKFFDTIFLINPFRSHNVIFLVCLFIFVSFLSGWL